MVHCKIEQLLCTPRTFMFGFCKAFGLPISTRNESEWFISMKSAAISFQSPEAVEYIKNPCRTNFLDPFVFGGMKSAWFQTKPDSWYNSIHIKEEIPNKTDQMGKSSLNDTETKDWGNLHARVDENRIFIPPSPVLWELLRG